MSQFILVHSPLVGPSTWRWVAEALAGRGHRVTVPVVRSVITPLDWEGFASAMAAQIDAEGPAILVGHSGAGPILPQIRARARRPPEALLFVDAGVPPEAGDAELVPPDLLVELRAMTVDGLLPKWSSWFGPGVMEELVPDPGQRAAVGDDLPQLPLSYFETRVPVPSGWTNAACGYVRLSEAYAAAAAEAASRGWPLVELPGAHLDIVARAEPVTVAILAVAAELAG
ncbi:MAG: alpha/beta hydrolase [Candidatus Dormiibacterota bacterium]